MLICRATLAVAASLFCSGAALAWGGPVAGAGPDAGEVVLADFEGDDYGAWTAEGEALGDGPARGVLPNQMSFEGFEGRGLVNTYRDGDGSEGSLTSPPFNIERNSISFLIGGGFHPGQTAINLIVDGEPVRTATGHDEEGLVWHAWDVAEFRGRPARIEIIDRARGGWGHINIDQIVMGDRPRATIYPNEAITRAMSALRSAIPHARSDPRRPAYHFLPPSRWMNDPNGLIQHGGYYHMFYQNNPYGDGWGHMHWGHARSKDLVRWEHLPIALWPSKAEGEDHCFSGCATVGPDGRLMALYTSIGPKKDAGNAADQWAAVAEDGEAIAWSKHPANPILSQSLHGDRKIYDWRDPFLFEDGGRSYLVLGGHVPHGDGQRGIVELYRAEDDTLTRWADLGEVFRHPDAANLNIECPNLFKLDDRWVLIISPHGPVDYFVGDLDLDAPAFRTQHRGILDRGNVYAPQCFEDDQGRRILWAWVNGFQPGHGWTGCMTLPRVLSLAKDGTLLQAPAAELESLRGEHTSRKDIALEETPRPIEGVEGDTLELVAEFEPSGTGPRGLEVRRSADGASSVRIAYDGRELEVAGTKAPLALPEGETALRLRVFLDRSVVEVYANDGRACITRVVDSDPADRGIAAFGSGEGARLRSLDAWQLRTDDVFRDRTDLGSIRTAAGGD